MESITVRKTDLLAALRENRGGHRAAFEAAQEGWRATIIEELDRRLADARAGRRVDSRFMIPEPEDHTTDYDRVIRMVEMEVNDTIAVPEHDFRCYVMDDWDWMASWTASNSGYVARTARAR